MNTLLRVTSVLLCLALAGATLAWCLYAMSLADTSIQREKLREAMVHANYLARLDRLNLLGRQIISNSTSALATLHSSLSQNSASISLNLDNFGAQGYKLAYQVKGPNVCLQQRASQDISAVHELLGIYERRRVFQKAKAELSMIQGIDLDAILALKNGGDGGAAQVTINMTESLSRQSMIKLVFVAMLLVSCYVIFSMNYTHNDGQKKRKKALVDNRIQNIVLVSNLREEADWEARRNSTFTDGTITVSGNDSMRQAEILRQKRLIRTMEKDKAHDLAQELESQASNITDELRRKQDGKIFEGALDSLDHVHKSGYTSSAHLCDASAKIIEGTQASAGASIKTMENAISQSSLQTNGAVQAKANALIEKAEAAAHAKMADNMKEEKQRLLNEKRIKEMKECGFFDHIVWSGTERKMRRRMNDPGKRAKYGY